MASPIGGTQMTPDPTTLGIPASFVFDSALVFPHPMAPVYSGSQLGVPAVDQIAGETPASNSAGPANYGSATAGGGPTRQPIFWSVILVVGGVLLITHAAKMNLRG